MTLSTLDSELNDESTHSFGVYSGSGDKPVSQDEKSSSANTRPYGAGMPQSILTETERHIMRMSRIIVFVFLLLVAATATGLTWHLTSRWDKDDFETKVRKLM